jgi:hypothetical protein
MRISPRIAISAAQPGASRRGGDRRGWRELADVEPRDDVRLRPQFADMMRPCDEPREKPEAGERGAEMKSVFRTHALSLAAISCGIVTALTPAMADGTASQSVSSPETSSPATIEEYWTPSQMEQARPVDNGRPGCVPPCSTPVPSAPDTQAEPAQ